MKSESVQRWLQAHCDRLDDVAGGIVLSQPKTGDFQVVAEWPAVGAAAGSLTAGLTGIAKEAIRRANSLVLVPAVVQKNAEHARVIATPVRAVNGEVIGAVALAVRSKDAEVAKRLLAALEGVCPSLAASLVIAAPESAVIASEKHHKIQELIVSGVSLPAAALKLANHLAQVYQFDRVSVGVIAHGDMSVAALSHGENMDERQALVRGIVAAMQEAADQNAPVLYPAGLQATPRIMQAHARLATQSGTALCTVPLNVGGKVTGALNFERKGTAPLTASDLELCAQIADAVAPVLELKRQAERSWWLSAKDALRQSWQRRGQRSRWIVAGGALLAVVILFLLPITFNVGAPARVEGAVQRVMTAPMDGFLRSTRVRPGDSVKKGDLLVELADQELLLEKRRWESELTRHQNNLSAAMGRSDRAQFAVNVARAAEAKAQLDLVDQQLARAHVVAPMDALVIQGDLTQVIGAPVKRGDTLLTLAPQEQYRVIVEVDERDIAYVKLGQRGRLALAAFPGETLSFSVQRITPVATNTRDGRNVFDVEAKLDAGSMVPRHGLQGVAKIATERHALAWIVTRRVVDWLRLIIWSWLP